MTQDDKDAPHPPLGPKPTRVRFIVLGAACALAVITYLHRVGFATAAAAFKGPLELDDQDIGNLMAAFMIAYGIFEIPWGSFGDRRGVRKPLGLVVLGGSICTAALALAAILPPGSRFTLLLLITLRFLFGAFQAGTFPGISRMMADWMPATERGFAQGVIWMSSRLGGALAPQILVPMFAAFGHWPIPVVIVAGIGLVWMGLFVPWFRDDPKDMPSVNASERQLILSTRRVKAQSHHDTPWGTILRSRSAWALCIMYGSLGYTGNFFLTLLPTYLSGHRGLPPETVKWLSSLPFACGVASCMSGGVISDQLLRKTGNRRWGRSVVGFLGLAIGSLAILATLWASDPIPLGILLCLTFAGNDLAMAPAWAAAADIGERHTGTLSGTMNMLASFTGALGALVTGRLLKSGDGETPFLIFSAVYAVGAVAWLLVDPSRPLEDSLAVRTGVGPTGSASSGGGDGDRDAGLSGDL